MKVDRRVLIVRDQTESIFSGILWRLCEASGALGATLVDAEGETVDYAGCIAPFDLRVAAAEWRLVLATAEAANAPAWSSTREIIVRSGRHSFGVSMLGEGYAVVLILPRGSFRLSQRALAEAAVELGREAGFAADPSKPARWMHVDVKTAKGEPRRPLAVWQNGAWRAVTILGRLSAGLAAREVGYLAQVPSGAELLLVREPGGKWFAGEP